VALSVSDLTRRHAEFASVPDFNTMRRPIPLRLRDSYSERGTKKEGLDHPLIDLLTKKLKGRIAACRNLIR
jgi:hypothetical protein